MARMKRLCLGALALLFLAVPAHAQLQPPPEAGSGWRDKPAVTATRQMVVAAHPLAAEAGLAMLRKSGSAIDATIATQMVLNLVEPQSSGIGGGAFLLHFDAGAKRLTTYDGRETAPKAARPDRFLQADGKPLPFRTAVKSGRSVGVPGLLRLLALAHTQYGKLPWADLFAPAIALAEQGFPVSARLNALLQAADRASFNAEGQAYFYDAAGAPRPPGFILKNPAFAATLRLIAREGADTFYEGPLARAIVDTVNHAPLSLGDMTLEDFASYAAKERPPVCAAYRIYEVCGMGPPSSGGLTVAMVLKLIAPFDLGGNPLTLRALPLIAEAEKLAYADRNRYMADSDFVSIPAGLLDDSYLAGRRKLIDPVHPMGKAEPGTPPRAAPAPGRDATKERPGTSQISIVDAAGNAVTMTTTIEGAFGSGLMVDGFLLNNELTDFAFRPTDADGRPVANRVEGGKRPRSSMAPTLVFEGARTVRMVTGSPGGSQIILYVLKSLIAQLDWGLDPQAAAALPNFGSRNGPFEIEAGPVGPRLAVLMQAKGNATRVRPMTSGLHIIAVRDGRLFGGADPRRDGMALGD